MAYEISSEIGRIYFSECGVITEDETYSVDNWEEALTDKDFKCFSKTELFWRIHDFMIMPTRANFDDAYPEGEIGSIRILRIEESDNGVSVCLHIDALDELYIDINVNACHDIREAVEAVAEGIRIAVVDDDEIRDFICTDYTNEQDIPYGRADIESRMMDEVFERSWFE